MCAALGGQSYIIHSPSLSTLGMIPVLNPILDCLPLSLQMFVVHSLTPVFPICTHSLVTLSSHYFGVDPCSGYIFIDCPKESYLASSLLRSSVH